MPALRNLTSAGSAPRSQRPSDGAEAADGGSSGGTDDDPDASAPPTHDATRLLSAVSNGDKAAARDLLPLVYEQLHGLAAACFRGQPAGHTLQPTALVHEAFVRLVHHQGATGDGRGSYNDRTHFLAVAATAMRQILTDHARRVRSAKRGGGRDRMNIDVAIAGGEGPPGRGGEPGGASIGGAGAAGSIGQVDLLALDEALEALEALDERKHRIVELRYFGGLSVEQVAEVLEVSTRTVEADWRAARAWLGARLSG
ncbi:MAG: sigma-70 family RNA polymerase sigma factor [Phycisphaerales bacterium]